MEVFHSFQIAPAHPGSKTEKSPWLTTGDILKLESLFPENPIWKARRGAAPNFYRPTRGEALALYTAMILYLEQNTPSEESYIGGGLTGGGNLSSSNLKSVFDDLIPFFEWELGIVVAVTT